jgi:hypothetical protein
MKRKTFKIILRFFLISVVLILVGGISYYYLGRQCNCSWDYKKMKEKIELNYAGFHDKIENRENEYNKLVEEIEKQTKNTTDFKKCDKLLKDYISFFNDRHIYMQVSDPSTFNKPAKTPSFQKIDENFCLLTLPSFATENINGNKNAEEIDSIVNANHEIIVSTSFLIIDITGNEGGVDYAYAPILSYVFSKKTYSIDVAEFWSSDDNIARIENILKIPNLPEDTKKQQQAMLKAMKVNKGSFVNPFGADIVKNELDTIYPIPIRVAILTDEKNASSAEQFLLEATLSDKVITFGTGNTSGTLDYSNIYFEFLPSSYHHTIFSNIVGFDRVYGRAMAVPTSRSLRVKRGENFDEHGYTPDILIPKNTKNKIAFIKAYLLSEKKGVH